jgi:hypothetical protein
MEKWFFHFSCLKKIRSLNIFICFLFTELFLNVDNLDDVFNDVVGVKYQIAPDEVKTNIKFCLLLLL